MPSILKKITPKGWLSKKATKQQQEEEQVQVSGGEESKHNSDENYYSDNQSISQTTASITSSKTSRGRRNSNANSNNSNNSTNSKSSNRFLLEAPVRQSVALLDRREIQVGKLLGEGGFCEVLEVTGFQLTPFQQQQQQQQQQSSTASSTMPASCREGMEQRRRERRRQDLVKTCHNDTKQFALKQISTKLLLIPGGFHQAAIDLITEANYLMRLDHPHILKIHAMAMDGRTAFANKAYDDLFLVVDRLGGTLQKLVDQWKYNPMDDNRNSISLLTVKTHYALQIASALEYLHQQRIVFRDLKPQNVGYLTSTTQDSNNNIKTLQLFDFGLCRELPDANANNKEDDEMFHMSKVGTPGYMAPEVSSGGYNCKADMFSFACLFYELLQLKHPFPKKQRRRIKSVPKDRPDLTQLGLPNSIQNLLSATWHPSVQERFTSLQTRIELEEILKELETSMEKEEKNVVN